MLAIKGSDIQFQYGNRDVILDHADLVIEAGKTTAILGRNGSGKSTLVKLITALLPLKGGKLTIGDLDVAAAEGIREVRNRCGIVFQNPDNQFVSPVIEEDIRFGLENHNVPEKEQPERIEKALSDVNLSGFEKRAIATLSGGQKQRAAAAGILALENDILIFDEATSMLDPYGREELLGCLEEQKRSGKTVIIITQNPDDVVNADRILLISEGKIRACGTPREILADPELMQDCGIRVPFPVRVFYDLQKSGILLEYCPLTCEELAAEVCSLN